VVSPLFLLAASLAAAQTPEHRPKTRGAALSYAVNGMALGDFDGVGKPQIALASDDQIRLYVYPALDAKPLAQAAIIGTGARVVGLEAADLDGDGRSELFASVYDPMFKRFETRVLKLESGRWLKTATLPFLVRAYQDARGARVLATQQVVEDNGFPFGRIYPLVYRDGKYSQGAAVVPTRRADWLFGFTTARLDDHETAISVTATHALRMESEKDRWRTSDDDYGQTPVRVRWGERLLEFPPPMAATYGRAGFDSLYVLRNVAALGGLAGPFGLFDHGELVRKRWNGSGFETDWRAELPGCAQGLAVAEPVPGRPEIVVASRGAANESSVWTYDP